MSKIMDEITKKAIKANRRIVLPEGEEKRVVLAAASITKQKIARVTLIGNPQRIKEIADKNVSLEGIDIIDPESYSNSAKLADLLYELRKAKGLTAEQARELVKNPLYLGVLLVKSGECDGMVAGSINSTGDVLRPALQVIKTAKGISTVSSCFIMVTDKPEYGANGVMVFGDCAVNINPNARQLADIALASAKSARAIAEIEPRVAMLSFSTKGSAKHELSDKVVEATSLINSEAPELLCDGELQADAALVESVGSLKCPNSPVAGKANVLIFPDLQSGNIGYKLVQRLAGADAIGPICQGFNQPVNDLSRGCSVEDIVNVTAITAVQV